jgi:asparagine N-glycosylation enzyme membrane subunit Stt3
MAFDGYLIAFGNQILSHKYIQLSSFDTTPNQRTELSAVRDNNNYLCRVTSPNHKTTIKFTTIPLNLTEKTTIQAIMLNGLVNEVERKYRITYWNDETNTYITSEFYMPDVNYQIKKIEGKNIEYNPISFEFIEY